MTNNLRSTRGFTIVESLVAITILVVAIVGATTAVQTGISSYIYSKDQIIAFYLAQEAVEQIRNMRDENRLKSRNWLYGIAANSSDPCYFGHACTVTALFTPATVRCPSIGNCPVLLESPSTGFLAYETGWTTTVFEREVVLSSINADEVAVTVAIRWNKGIVEREFIVRENLLNWQ